MKRFYRLQQRLGMTRTESLAILFITSLLLIGLAAGEVMERLPTVSPLDYAEADQRFAERAAQPLSTQVSLAPTPDAPLDLNTATAEALERLPRIGPKIAARIVDYRTTHGPFRSIAALTEVRGIGEKTLAQLAPLLTLGPVE